MVARSAIAAALGTRVARRRERMRAALLAAAAKQFAKRGVAAVSVEELLAEADVSRATFYGLFPSKYNLLEEILNPIFDAAIEAMRGHAALPAAQALEGLIETYLALWREHREGLLLIPLVTPESFAPMAERHEALNRVLLEVLHKAEGADLLRNGSAHYSLKVIARTAIPLLRVYDGHPAADALFKDALQAILIRAH